MKNSISKLWGIKWPDHHARNSLRNSVASLEGFRVMELRSYGATELRRIFLLKINTFTEKSLEEGGSTHAHPTRLSIRIRIVLLHTEGFGWRLLGFPIWSLCVWGKLKVMFEFVHDLHLERSWWLPSRQRWWSSICCGSRLVGSFILSENLSPKQIISHLNTS